LKGNPSRCPTGEVESYNQGKELRKRIRGECLLTRYAGGKITAKPKSEKEKETSKRGTKHHSILEVVGGSPGRGERKTRCDGGG